MSVLKILLEKEFRQFFRDPFLPKMVIFFPLMVMLVFPWVTTMDVRHIGVSVVDHDHTKASQRMIQKIQSSDYYTLYGVGNNFSTSLQQLEAGKVDVILEIPEGFEESISQQKQTEQVIISANGVNAIKGSLGMQYLLQTVSATITELRQEQGIISQHVPIVIQNRYNPTLEYHYYMIPALMIMLLILIGGFLPALNLVNEKEQGTIEQINVTPVSQFHFTLAKLILYWVVGIIVLSLAILLGWLIYGLVPEGSLGAIYLAALLFILIMSGFGVVAANYSSTMIQAIFGMFFFIMIFILMSGLLTPVESMPQWAQRITYALPPRYFIGIMRAIYLKGATLADLWIYYIILAGFAIVLNTWAVLSYHKRS